MDTETTLEKIVKELPLLISKRNIKREGDFINLSAEYTPSQKHSEVFCYATRDKNPIHEQIAPAFLQFSTAILLIRKAMKEKEVDYLEYPFVFTYSDMSNVVLNEAPYIFEIKVIEQDSYLEASANLLNPITESAVYTLYMKSCKEGFKSLPEPRVNPVHSKLLIGEGEEMNAFNHLVGFESPERMLYVLASSSSVVFDAIREGKLKPDPEITAVYKKQEIYFNTGATPNPKKGVNIELYLKPEEFGKRTTKDLGMTILGSEDNLVYMSHSTLQFLQNEFMLKWINRARKKVKDNLLYSNK